MPIKILMPALSPTMKDGTLAKWNKKEGDKISAGQVIAEIETDKATMEVEAVDEGVLGRILVPAGSKGVKVNAAIAILLEEGEDKSALDGFEVEEVTTPVVVQEPKAEVVSAPAHHAPAQQNRIFASPLAKRIAQESNVDLATIQGSGPMGRIVKEDVLSASGSKRAVSTMMQNMQVGRASPETTSMAISTMREVVAKRLTESKTQVPHFYASVDCDITKLLQMREDINQSANAKDPEFKISVNDMVVRASALALREVPAANTSWGAHEIIQYNNVDISVAVSVKDGLITPIVFNADQKSIFVISNEIKSLAAKAHANALKPQEFQGGGFTVSNMGMFGVKNFNAIINPPQSCILAIGAGIKQPVVQEEKIVISTIMNVTLSCDHRVVDGAVGAQLLSAFKKLIENPVRLLI